MKKMIILILTFLLTGCGYDEYKIPEDAYINIKNEKVNVYDELSLYDLVGDTNVKILDKDKTLNTKNTGNYKLELNYKYNNRKYKFKFSYDVVDQEKPVYISATSIKTLIKGNTYDFCKSIVFGDNYDRNPECFIDGEYDLNKTGVYKVNYVLKDDAGNTNEKSLKINVVDKIVSKPGNNTSNKNYLYFDEVINRYKTEDTLVGIDVSRWQTDIDWQRVKDAGVEFVIMRIGVQSDYDKEISMDTYFQKNIKGARAVGLKVGVYVYTTATNNKVAEAHAKWVIDALDGIKLDFPIAFDWENWSKFRKYEININDLSESFNAFERVVKKHGYDAMLYSSKFYLENIWINKHNHPVWLAHYTLKTNYKGDYILWQLANTGRVDGINGDVDIDVYYKKK